MSEKEGKESQYSFAPLHPPREGGGGGGRCDKLVSKPSFRRF